MLFPVKSLTAVPMRVTSDDDALFPDLAALHAERLGLRPDPMAGQLTDVFVIAREAENTSLLAVFLRSPGDGDLPTRGPKSFDISARAFPVTGEYPRPLAGIRPLGVCRVSSRKTRILPSHRGGFGDSGRLARPRNPPLTHPVGKCRGWKSSPPTSSSGPPMNPSIPRSFAPPSKCPLKSRPARCPFSPAPLSKLLPADVRAARRAALRRRNIILGVAAVALIYLGLIGWFGYGLWKGMSETKKLLAQAEEAAPEGEAYALHIAKWDELAHVIDLSNSPVDILNRIAICIPPNSGLRLKIADISSTEIKLQGEAPQLQAVNTFSLKLTKNNDLANFTWQTPEPNQSTRGWEFIFTGEVPTVESQP